MVTLIPRRAQAACLLLGPLLFATGDLLRRLVVPSNGSDGLADVRHVHDHPGLWQLAALLAAASVFVLIPGLGAVVGLVSDRGLALTRVGTLLLGAGLLASIGHMTAYFGLDGLYDKAALDPAAITQVDKASEAYGPLVGFIPLFIVGMFLGLLLLTIGLRRARVVPIWTVVTALAAIVTGSTGGLAAGVVGLAAWVATFTPIALAVLRTADDARPAVAHEESLDLDREPRPSALT